LPREYDDAWFREEGNLPTLARRVICALYHHLAIQNPLIALRILALDPGREMVWHPSMDTTGLRTLHCSISDVQAALYEVRARLEANTPALLTGFLPILQAANIQAPMGRLSSEQAASLVAAVEDCGLAARKHNIFRARWAGHAQTNTMSGEVVRGMVKKFLKDVTEDDQDSLLFF
jgi:hypothetical protein